MVDVAFVTLLRDHHDLEGFSCGEDSWDVDLNDFLRNDARNDQRQGLNRTYLFLDEDHNCVGFVAVLCGQVHTREPGFPRRRRTRYRSAPALHVGRIAVRDNYQRQGHGRFILSWVRHTARDLSVGCRFIALDVDEGNTEAIRFYEREGFLMTNVKHEDQPNMRLMIYDLYASGPAPEKN